MNASVIPIGLPVFILAGLVASPFRGLTQQNAVIQSFQWSGPNELILQAVAPAGQFFSLQASQDFDAWATLRSFAGESGGFEHRTLFSRMSSRQFFRLQRFIDPPALLGDHFPTNQGDLIIHPIEHASFVMTWNGVTIYNDPVGGAARFAGLNPPDLILISHSHGDHFDPSTLNAVAVDSTVLIAPQAATSQLSRALQAAATVLNNDETHETIGITIEAIPAYNSRHSKGEGNGYVLNLGGKRIYISGDTEDIPEMRALRNIDAAFICMNLPFTMSVEQAADAVREFQPAVVYPYHHRNSDVQRFKTLVGTDLPIEVRLREWY